MRFNTNNVSTKAALLRPHSRVLQCAQGTGEVAHLKVSHEAAASSGRHGAIGISGSKRLDVIRETRVVFAVRFRNGCRSCSCGCRGSPLGLQLDPSPLLRIAVT